MKKQAHLLMAGIALTYGLRLFATNKTTCTVTKTNAIIGFGQSVLTGSTILDLNRLAHSSCGLDHRKLVFKGIQVFARTETAPGSVRLRTGEQDSERRTMSRRIGPKNYYHGVYLTGLQSTPGEMIKLILRGQIILHQIALTWSATDFTT